MNGPDLAAQAALAERVRRPVTFCFLDIAGEPVRVTDAPYSFTFAGTGDEDLDGFTFEAVDARVVSVGDVKAKEGGTDTLTLTLSGLAGIDGETMNAIGNRSNYQGRDARLWKAMLDPVELTRIGAIWCRHRSHSEATSSCPKACSAFAGVPCCSRSAAKASAKDLFASIGAAGSSLAPGACSTGANRWQRL